MIGANMVPTLLLDKPEPFLRLYSSFAAPIFILLSGMMVSFTIAKKSRSLIYFLKRALVLVAIGALIDVFISGIYPFMTFDVLYLIGISMPITFLFKKLNVVVQSVLVIMIFTLTPFLHNVFGYHRLPMELPISLSLAKSSLSLSLILHQLLIDGWFPLFPWLGFAFLGSMTADIRIKYKRFSTIPVLLGGLVTLILGEILWTAIPGQLYIRRGYIELFYPPTLGFILTAIGVIIILFCIIDFKSSLAIYKPLAILGRWSLHAYVIHLILIHILKKNMRPQSREIFLLVYISMVIFIFGLVYVIEKIKAHSKSNFP
jgi:uncharacterized membrane protein